MSRLSARVRAASVVLAVSALGVLGLGPAQAVGVAMPGTSAGSATTAPSAASASEPDTQSDELPNPDEDKRRALRSEAVQQVIAGTAKPEQRGGSTVVKVGRTAGANASQRRGPAQKDQYVELSRAKTDKIFVVLAEFGDERHPNYPDQDTSAAFAGPARFDGPLHNQIPQPDRTVDNSTNWQPDFSADSFHTTYFGTGGGDESLKQYYQRQSSGRYSVDGVVTDWVKVRYNEARYGRSNGYPCGGNVCSNTWFLIQDAANKWYADQLAAGRSEAEVAADLAQFDQWDRYDYDGDGDFNEPDGYIDHFQIVHAGGDQADGDPWQGEDAIWSHRWKVFQGTGDGPAYNRDGGTQIGGTGMWIADYTIQPENGGRSVFYHEYGHDLGLPDDYDTTGAGDNPTMWWTLMAQSRLGAADEPSIGNRGGDLGAWNKLMLGWLDYVVVPHTAPQALTLGPQEYNSAKPQALVMPLPKKVITTSYGAPAEGAKQWWSGDANNLDNTLARQVTLPAGAAASLTFQARYDIEDCGPDPCDYAYVEVSTGGDWTAIPGSITKAAEGNGIDGTSAAWVPATFDLSPYAGQTIGLRLRYRTDGAVGGNDPAVPNGLFVDQIAVTSGGTTVFSDNAETAAPGWAVVGWSTVGSSTSTSFDQYYIAGWRTYVSYDRYLKSGPYNFGDATKPDWVEHFPNQQGLLISYWDTSQHDNNVSQHPGQGLNLYIDSRPATLYRLDGQPWRTRIQIYDAPFSPWKADSFTLHYAGQPSYIRGPDGNPLFDDRATYYDPALPNHGVKLPAVGARIRVVEPQGTSVRIRVS